MNRKQKNEAQMLVRAQAFAEGKAPDFANTPTKPGDAKFAATLPELDDTIGKLGGKAAIQAGGAYGEESEDQKVFRGEVEEVLRSINRDAAAIATEKQQPGLMDRFRMLQGTSDDESRTKLIAFADAIEDLGLGDELAALGQEQTPASLRLMAENFQGTEGDQGNALADQTGATKAIPVLLREGRALVKILNSLFHNRYQGNAEVLGAWKTASAVRKTDTPDEPPAPPAPAPA